MYSNLLKFFPFSLQDEDPEKSKVLLLIKLRWIFILVQFFIIIPYLALNAYDYKDLVFYLGISISLVGFNIILFGIWENIKSPVSESLVFTSLLIDVIYLTILSFFLIHVVNIQIESICFVNATLGAILLNGRKNIVFYFCLAISFTLIQYMQVNIFMSNLVFSKFVFNHIVLLLVWVMARTVNKHIYEQNKLLGNIKEQTDQLDRLRAVGALSAGFSHEFSSPLNTVKLRLSRIYKKNQDVESLAALEAVGECERIIRQMNNSQLDSRQYVFQKIHLPQSIREIIKSWTLDFETVKVNFVDLTNDSKKYNFPIINFSQGLLNVLDNAFESSSGCNVQIFYEIIDENLQLKVLDDGEGFSEDVISRFGEPFLTTKEKGTGLGLYSFLMFAKSIGGSLEIGNRPEGGAIIVFKAPLFLNEEV